MAANGGLSYGKIGTSVSRLMDAEPLRKVVLPILKETPDLAIKRLSDSSYIWE